MEVLPRLFQAAPRTVVRAAIEGPTAITRQLESRGLKRKFSEAFLQAPSLARIQAWCKEQRFAGGAPTEEELVAELSSSYRQRELEQEHGHRAAPAANLPPLQLPPDVGYLRAPTDPPRKRARMSDAAELEQAMQEEEEEAEEQQQQAKQQDLEQVLSPEQMQQAYGPTPPSSSDISSVPSAVGTSASDGGEEAQAQAQAQAAHPVGDSHGSEEEKKVLPQSSQWTSGEGKVVYRGHKVYPVEGDGRCLFRAVVLAFFLNRGQWRNPDELRNLADQLRHEAMNLMERCKSSFEWIVEGDFDTYVARMRRPGVWGGEPELVVLSQVLLQPIIVHVTIPTDASATVVVAEYGKEFRDSGPPIRVLYDGAEHYNALVLLEDLDSSYVGTDTDSDTSSDADYGTDLD